MSERTLTGIGATPLAGTGGVVWYRPDADLELSEPPAPDDTDPQAERERFENARDQARDELETERERAEARVGAEEAAVFDAHIQFLDDPQVESDVTDAIDEGLPAEHAVHEAFSDSISQFERMEGRMAERADDLRDVRDRLVRLLTDADRIDLGGLPDGSVVFAERLTPSDTAQLDPETVACFATSTGGRTTHAAIFARSLALPAVVGVDDTLAEVEEGTDVVVDGGAGEVVVDPNEEIREQAARTERSEVRAEPVATADGTSIEVAANIGGPIEIDGATGQGADGIGLYRTEFLVLDRNEPPNEDEQYDVYCEALETFPEGSVTAADVDDAVARLISSADANHVTLVVGGEVPSHLREETDEWSVSIVGEMGLRDMAEHQDIDAILGSGVSSPSATADAAEPDNQFTDTPSTLEVETPDETATHPPEQAARELDDVFVAEGDADPDPVEGASDDQVEETVEQHEQRTLASEFGALGLEVLLALMLVATAGYLIVQLAAVV
jgi:phosphohistidine swiveling domain-containing protein